jgi:creatinine amidohydrolase
MMSNASNIADLTWVEYRHRLAEDDAIVMIPVGALEQHGPHLPLSVDTLLTTEITNRAAARIGALVAPPVAYGCRSQPRSSGGNHFPGTTSLEAGTMTALIRDLINGLARHGVRQIAVINGHLENDAFLSEGIERAMVELHRDGLSDVKVLKMSYFETISPETIDTIWPDGFPGLALEHAAVMETSMMLHVAPGLVHMDRLPDEAPADIPPYDVYPPETGWVPPSGGMSPAHSATAQIGKTLIDEFVTLVAESVGGEFR